MIYVTSDLHGFDPEQFRALLDKAGFCQDDYLFVLGDVIDRGEHGVALLRWMAEQPNVQLILGNHEAMLLSCEFLFQPVTEETVDALTPENMECYSTWLFNGAEPTIRELNALAKNEPDILEGILDYLHDAPLYDTVTLNGKHYILVHSGLGDFDPERPLHRYEANDLLWARPTLQTRYLEGATVIFGHTPTEFIDPEQKGKAVRTDTWMCIDTGVATGGSPMLLRLDDEKEFYL